MHKQAPASIGSILMPTRWPFANGSCSAHALPVALLTTFPFLQLYSQPPRFCEAASLSARKEKGNVVRSGYWPAAAGGDADGRAAPVGRSKVETCTVHACVGPALQCILGYVCAMRGLRCGGLVLAGAMMVHHSVAGCACNGIASVGLRCTSF